MEDKAPVVDWPNTFSLRGDRPNGARTMNWKSGLVAAGMAIGAAQMAQATVETKLYADTYIVVDGDRVYSVLDIYAKGNHLGDTLGASITGLISHPVIFKTSQATTGADVFVHGGSAGNGWLPTDSAAKSWDSFIAAGNRAQGANAKVTNRAGSLIDHGIAGNWTGASSFTQMGVAGSNYIDEGTASGWYSSKGGNAHSAAGASENPFARVSLYNSTWNTAYGDLYRGADVLLTKGQMQTGRTTAAGDPVLAGAPGSSLDFHWMVGRFTIDITDRLDQTITMQAQFNMVGKNGSGTNNETGTTFSGALTSGTNPQYKVSNHFTFGRFPPPIAVAAADGLSANSIEVGWQQGLNVVGASLAGFRVLRTVGGSEVIAGNVGPSARSFTDTQAPPGVQASYRVQSIFSFGISGQLIYSWPSTPDNGWRRLSPPATIQASNNTSDRITLSWAGATGATGYKVLRGPSAQSLAEIAQVAGTSYVDMSVAPLVTYTYAVRASCALGDSDTSSTATGRAIADCNGNGIDDASDLNPPVSIASGNMGTLVGGATRTATLAITQAPTSGVNVVVDALGDLDSDTEYLIVKLTKAGTTSPAITRDLFKTDGLGCPATAQRTTFALTAPELQSLLGGPVGNLKVDVIPTPAVGLADSTCQATSSVSVTLEYITRNAAIDCNGNGVIDSCEIAQGSQADCNQNGIPDSCEIAAGQGSDLNSNGVLDSCEYLVGSPAYPTLSSAISAAPNGAVVPVLPGTYDGPVDLGAKGLTLRSTGGKGVTTIRGASTGSTVRVSGGGQIEGFFIQGGGGDEESGVRRGGALRITAGSVTIKDCDIRAGDVGSSGEGGLVFIRDAAPVFVNCRLEMGTAGLGGGVYARATTGAIYVPAFDLCMIRNNSATVGGGMFLRGNGMRPLLTGVNFEQNIGSTDGGALYSLEGARPSLSGCRACGNTLPVVVGGYDEPALNRLTDDCNADGICDADQLLSGALSDDDADGIPDVCQDCDGDGESDRYSIAQGWVPDCNGNQIPDSCDIAAGAADCNGNGVPDSCDVSNVAFDCNRDGQIDTCQALADCNANGRPDVCDIASGAALDCNANGVPDNCDVVDGTDDCNANGIPDSCDIAAGREEDQDGGGVPDSCQYAVGDLDLSGGVDTADIGLLLLFFDTTGPIGDLDGDQLVTTADLALMLLNFE
jgi:hypothetical protein